MIERLQNEPNKELFVLYCKEKGIPVNIESYEQFLQEKPEKEEDQFTFLLDTSKERTMERKLWNDIYSTTYQYNEQIIEDAKKQVISKITSFGYKNAEELYHRCVDVLRYNTVLINSFHAKHLPNFNRHRLLNCFDLNSKGSAYHDKRNRYEQTHYAYLPDDLYQAFKQNTRIRPSYGSAHLSGANNHLSTTHWGTSFVVFKDSVKLNALFFPRDSFCSKVVPATYHHMGIMLQHLEDEKLKKLLHRVNSGETFTQYNAYMCGAEWQPNAG